MQEEKDKEFVERMESNKAKCEEKTAKKREKRCVTEELIVLP